MTPEAREIHDAHDAWIAAVNAGDLAFLMSRLADDAVLFSPGTAPFGPEQFAANFKSALERFRFRCSSELEEVVIAGTVAYTRSRDGLAVTPLTGGREERLAGHRMTVYRKHADGRWLLARDAHTLMPVAS